MRIRSEGVRRLFRFGAAARRDVLGHRAHQRRRDLPVWMEGDPRLVADEHVHQRGDGGPVAFRDQSAVDVPDVDVEYSCKH